MISVKQADGIRTTDAFMNAMARLGYGQPNMLEFTEYPLTRLTRDYNLMNSLYRSHWVIRRLIDAVPEDMTKNWFQVQSQMPPDDARQLERLERVVNLRMKLIEGLRWGRLYGGAAGVIMIAGHEDILDEPLDLDMVMPDSFKGILILDRWSGVYPMLDLVEDIGDPEFGLPKYYSITAEGVPNTVVHHSRILRFSGRDLPHWERQAESYWGASEVEHVFDELKKRDNTSWNIAQLIFVANLRVLKMNELGQILVGGTAQLQNQLYSTLQAQNWLMNNMGMHVMDAKDSMETHQYTFSGLSEVYDAFMMDVAGAAEMPVTKLFGRSPAGLNATGESDMQNYYDSIEQKQESQLRPVLEKLLPVMCVSEFGVIPDDLLVSFNPCRRPSEREKKDLGKNIADSVINAFNAGLISQRISLQELRQSAEFTGMWSNITDDAIEKASDEVELPGEGMPDLGGLLGGGPSASQEEPSTNEPVIDGGPGSGRKPEGGSSEEKEYSPDVAKLMGKEYPGKGQAAIERLLQEKNGHVKGAFHRKGIGEIDLLWGDDTFGLQHIIKRRTEEGLDGESFLFDLPKVIQNGKVKKQSDGRFAISLGDTKAVISPELRGDKVTFLLTAFETT